jgi:hypothetical protein
MGIAKRKGGSQGSILKIIIETTNIYVEEQNNKTDSEYLPNLNIPNG